MFDIWTKRNELAENAYQKENFKITKNTTGKGYCIIYCSSNNIWFPNEEENFKESIINKNRFEWTRIKCELASKEIYIRDIYKSWYVTGINKEINCIDKLIYFLESESAGYTVIVIGASSGGYLAALLGMKLKASHVIAFSAQYELRNNWAQGANPFLQHYDNDSERNKYFDLKPWLLSSNTPIYYIVPIKNKIDYYHYQYIKDIPCINPLVFSSRHHGVVMYKSNLSIFISMEKKEIDELVDKFSGKVISPLTFSIKMSGIKNTFIDLLNSITTIIKKFH